MRTVILLGAFYIGDAIQYGAGYPDEYKQFLAWILMIAIVMDLVDFFRTRGGYS